MGIVDRLLKRADTKATIKSGDPYLAEYFGLRTGTYAADLSRDQASGLPIAFSCVSLISQTLASMPLTLYARTSNGGREKAVSHPLFGTLKDMANESVTAFEAREYLAASVLVHGNGYARLQWSGKGQVEAIYPLDPKRVTVERLDSGRLRYKVTTRRGVAQMFTQDEILHIRHKLDADGLYGVSPISAARIAFNLGLEHASQAHKQAQRGFRPSGTLSFPDLIGADGKAEAMDLLSQKASDTSERGGILVLDGGVSWSPLAFNSKDAEFLDSRRLSDLAIARIFHCPPTSVGIPDNATYSNVLGENQALVARCLSPMAKRIEAAMNAALLPESARSRMYVEHGFDSLLRGDLEARYGAYAQGRQWGILTTNEIRARENLPAVEGGDTLLTPLNMSGDSGSSEDG